MEEEKYFSINFLNFKKNYMLFVPAKKTHQVASGVNPGSDEAFNHKWEAKKQHRKNTKTTNDLKTTSKLSRGVCWISSRNWRSLTLTSGSINQCWLKQLNTIHNCLRGRTHFHQQRAQNTSKIVIERRIDCCKHSSIFTAELYLQTQAPQFGMNTLVRILGLPSQTFMKQRWRC